MENNPLLFFNPAKQKFVVWVANRSALAHNAACLSASESRMWTSLGSLLWNKQLKKAFFSWPLGQRRSISATEA
jgi:hypothetical protein